MLQKNENEIMKNWSSSDEPIVSILCIAFNHEKYIEEALDSFLLQKTNFPFEIIIHDDASTDNTVKIIKNYVQKYPSIIKTILQKENQYSQGKMILTFLLHKAQGKYLAICDGDDYWIDKNKLQMQIDLMKQYPSCYMSFHPTEIRRGGDKYGNIHARHAKGNKVFSTSEIILGGGEFCPSASIIINKEVVSTLPDFFIDTPVGDYFIQIFSALNGGALYIDKVMAVYRQGVIDSWSSKKKSIAIREEFFERMIKILDKLDNHLNLKYHTEIAKIKSFHYYRMSLHYLENNMFINFRNYIETSHRISKLKSIQWIIHRLRYFPKTLKKLLKIKNILLK